MPYGSAAIRNAVGAPSRANAIWGIEILSRFDARLRAESHSCRAPWRGQAFAGTDQSDRNRHLHRPNGQRLPVAPRTPMFRLMFAVSEAQTAAIRGAFDEGGEFSAAIELRRIFPAITNNATAREYARVIAGRDPPPTPSPPAHPPLHEVVPMHATKGHPAGSG